ncbi:MAG: CRISPR-associated helicase Cas3' [Acidobacteriaceae bacterium]
MVEKQARYRHPWGKINKITGEFHHLAHHCADVAACFEVISSLPAFRARLERAAGEPLAPVVLERLAVICFLHDVGKLHPGFQAKGWPEGTWRPPLHGHLQEGAVIYSADAPPNLATHLCLDDLIRWGLEFDLLYAALSHHGRPLAVSSMAADRWNRVQTPQVDYDPAAAAADIGAVLRDWFPLAFSSEVKALPRRAEFQHLFCGMVSLADWLGSDRGFFNYAGKLDPDYIRRARQQARSAACTIGLDVRSLQSRTAKSMNLSTVIGFTSPNATQRIVDRFSVEEQLVILEAETGSGKTEAAFWRFARLFEAGKVEGLYFALPTRTSAVQLHSRVNQMLKRLFGEHAPEAILAVPGYMKSGEVEGVALPGWKVLWEDADSVSDEILEARWAAESSKRYLAATVAVGTVDQAMLAGLQVKHAHLRGAALSRSLLVIDEVHASDSYMAEVLHNLLRIHMGRGGHALLMSATLGSRARGKWLGTAATAFDAEKMIPYPAVWGRSSKEPLRASSAERQKSVELKLVPSMESAECAHMAMRAAQCGARVLVIRNTVTAAVDAWQAVRLGGGESLLLRVSGGPALHHGRFAPEDRKLLDRAVEAALSPKACADGGVIVIGTQTLEQSLDIDADLLITDLCPVDVLLQRIGRLHRHASVARPVGFETPRCHVLTPSSGLEPLLAPAFENGLGAWREKKGHNGIYRDLSMLELTRRLIVEHPVWTLPAMNRVLVESATHEEQIDALHSELGRKWSDYRNEVVGSEIAARGAAKNVSLHTEISFSDNGVLFAQDEESIRTRLGEEGARITFAETVRGPFGVNISGLTLPAHWSQGLDSREAVRPMQAEGLLTVELGNRMFLYNRSGLSRGSK